MNYFLLLFLLFGQFLLLIPFANGQPTGETNIGDRAEMAATDEGSASRNVSEVSISAANEKVAIEESIEEIDKNPMAIIVPAESPPIPMGDKRSKKEQKQKNSTAVPAFVDDAKRMKQLKRGTRFDERQRDALWRHFVKFEDYWAADHPAGMDRRQDEEQKERFKLERLLGLDNRQVHHWLYNIKSKLSTNSLIIREQFEMEKKKYQSEMAAIGGSGKASASASAPDDKNEQPNSDETKQRFDHAQKQLLWRHFVKFEDVWTSDNAAHDRRIQEQEERFELADLLKAKKKKVYKWLHNTKTGLKNRKSIHKQFEMEKRKYQSEIAATGDDNASASASASKVTPAAANVKFIHGTRFDDDQRAALWRHFVRFEDVLVNENANVDRQKEEKEERFKVRNSIGLTSKQIKNWYDNTKTRLKTRKSIRKQFEMEKRKYQSEIAANDASASASASKVSPAVAYETSNVEETSSSEETDPNPLAIIPYVPAGPILQNKSGKKRKNSSKIIPVAGDEKKAKKPKQKKERFEHYQTAALWRHLARFEDVLITKQADVHRQKEEEEECSKLANSIKLTPRQIYKWIYYIKSKLSKNSLITRLQFESEKKKYQSEMAADIAGGGKDKASASASPPAKEQPNVDLNLNLEQSNPAEEDKMQEDE